MRKLCFILTLVSSFCMQGAFAQKATTKEIADFKKYMQEKNIKSIDLPFVFASGGVNFAGMVSVREPFEESSLSAVAVGAIIGECKLDKNRTECMLRDPTTVFMRAVLQFNFAGREIRARIDTKEWSGSWSEGDWVVAWRQ